MKFVACLLTLAAMTSACHAPEDYLLSPSQIDQMLTVTVSAAAVSADGVSRVTITAQLDPRTDADKRDVTFTTTAGMLIGGGREGQTITIPADDAAKAVAELRSPSFRQLRRSKSPPVRSAARLPSRFSRLLEATCSMSPRAARRFQQTDFRRP